MLLDERGEIEWVNPAWERTTGYSESDVLHVSFIRFIDIDDYARFVRGFIAKDSGPVRLLHKGGGVVKIILIDYKFKRRNPLLNDEIESESERIKRQAYIILRPIR